MVGIKNIYRMTAPLGYAAGGPASITALEKRGLGEKEFDLREDIVQKTNEMISYLNKRVGEQSFGAGPAAEITNYLTEERRKENPDYDRLNEMYLDYSSMDDFKDAQPKEEKGMGEKIMQGLGELFGGRGAEAGVYIPDETLDKMSIDEVVREIELLGPPMFGMSVGPNYVQHLRDLANALEKKIEE